MACCMFGMFYPGAIFPQYKCKEVFQTIQVSSLSYSGLNFSSVCSVLDNNFFPTDSRRINI